MRKRDQRMNRFLEVILEEGPVSISGLAKRLTVEEGVSASSSFTIAIRILEQLKRRGYITIEEGVGRGSVVEVTPYVALVSLVVTGDYHRACKALSRLYPSYKHYFDAFMEIVEATEIQHQRESTSILEDLDDIAGIASLKKEDMKNIEFDLVLSSMATTLSSIFEEAKLSKSLKRLNERVSKLPLSQRAAVVEFLQRVWREFDGKARTYRRRANAIKKVIKDLQLLLIRQPKSRLLD